MILRLCQASLFCRAVSRRSSLGGSARHLSLILLLASFFIAARPIPALAAILYGDYMGSTVNYKMVTEESPTGDPLPMYGPPTIQEFPYPALPCTVATCTLPGDSLDFNPVGFDANSSNGGADTTDGQLMFMVEVKDKLTQALNNIKFKEFGDTTLAGNSGNNGTLTAVTSDLFIDIVEVNGAGINAVKIQAAQAFTPFGGVYLLGTHGGGTFYHTQWMGEKLVDLKAALVAAGYPVSSRITKINVNMDNTLTAVSQGPPISSSALIAKKDQIIITTNVPEPASCSLVLMALAVGVCVARRARP